MAYVASTDPNALPHAQPYGAVPGAPAYQPSAPYAQPPPAYASPGAPAYPSQPYVAQGAYAPQQQPFVAVSVAENSATKAGGSGGPPSAAGYAETWEKRVRQGFIAKVYGILCVQLAITAGIVVAFVLSDAIKQKVQNSPGMMYAAIGLQLGFMLVLICCRHLTKLVPWNYLLLFGFTLAEAYLVGTISSFYDTNVVLIALGLTCGITLALSLFAWQTKIDFTVYLGAAVAALWGMIMFGFLMIWFRSNALQVFYATLGAILMSFFILIDTQMLIGGKHKIQFSPDDYIAAALNLYLDIVQLFLYILRILGKK